MRQEVYATTHSSAATSAPNTATINNKLHLNCCHATNKAPGEMHRVFVYGTLKSKEPNAHVIADAVEKGHARFLCRAQTIDRYPLIIASRYNIPFLLHHPGEGKNVRGEIYEVSDETLAVLDDFEGHPEVYLRHSLKVSMHFDGGDATTSDEENNDSAMEEDIIVDCWTYFLYDFEPNLLRKHEFLENYSNHDVSHGLCYVARYDRPATSPHYIHDVKRGRLSDSRWPLLNLIPNCFTCTFETYFYKCLPEAVVIYLEQFENSTQILLWIVSSIILSIVLGCILFCFH